MVSPPPVLPPADPVALHRAVGRMRAAAAAPWLHEEAARRMADRLPLVKLQPDVVLDWSGPLGASQALLRQAYPKAKHLAVGIAAPPAPARRWPWSRPAAPALQVLADDAVPAGQVQLLWANMMLHGAADPQPVFERWRQAMAVGGFLMFSTLGPGTLPELRDIYRAQGWGPPMAPPIDMHDLGDQLVQAGFADPVMDMEIVTLTYDSLDALLAELRAAGSICAMNARRRGLTGRAVWDEVRRRYEDRRRDGRLPATFEVVYGHAWKAAAKTTADGRAIIRFADRR
jgi:malonyl-CoA O-methyltransferase